MIRLDDFTVDSVLDRLDQDALQPLNLSGRKAFHSQGIYGQNEVVAVVDTGVNAQHPELQGRVLPGKNFCPYGHSQQTDDDHGHGTHVAGSVAGTNTGIAPQAEILPVKVLAGDGSGNLKDLVAALRWIREWRHPVTKQKATIVSMSLSTDGKRENPQELAALHESIKELVSNDIAVIVSAGNTGKIEERFPAAYEEVICVGAVDLNNERALFSTMGDHVDVCQIGVNVLSAWYKGGYAVMSGTSMSTPIVSGIGALLACRYRQRFGRPISENALWERLKENTKDLGIPGADRQYGTGFCTLQPLMAKTWVQHQNANMLVNGQVKVMDVPPEIRNGRFMLPFRFLGEVTGACIQYLPTEQAAWFIY